MSKRELAAFSVGMGLAELAQLRQEEICEQQIHFEHIGRSRESASIVHLKQAIAR